MKLFQILTVLIILVFITGCSENQQINSPNTESEIQKTTNPEDPSYLDTESAIFLDMIPDWINLPTPSSLPQNTTFLASKWIINSKLNNFIIDTSYSGGLYGSVSIKLRLMFDKGVLPSDSLFVTADVNINNGTIKFGPAAVFSQPVWLNYTITGLDFSTMDPNEIRFIYASDNGTIEPINCDRYEIDESKGSIRIWWGQILHFSRYGFVR